MGAARAPDLFSITAGAATQLVRVSALDALGNVARSVADIVTIAIGNNPAGGTLTGTTDVTPGNGVAIFSDLNISPAGSYTLRVTADGLAAVTSTAFTTF